MSFPESPHIAVGAGTQVGIVTLWTKKEHVMARVPEEYYAVIGQLYSRDEGISSLVRSLLANPHIRDIIIVGADLNKCSDTLLALWNEGVSNGQIVGAPGYVDTEIPETAINVIRKKVKLHDLRTEKDYSKLVDYIEGLPEKDVWGEPEIYPEANVEPPRVFPNAKQNCVRADSIEKGVTELAHMMEKFGMLYNVQLHLTEKGKLPSIFLESDASYTENLLGKQEGTYGELLHRNNRLGKLTAELTKKDFSVITFGDDDEEPLLDLIELFRADDGLHLTCHSKNTSLEEFPLLASGMFSLLSLIAGELDEPACSVTLNCGVLSKSMVDGVLREKTHLLRREGDPRSNVLIKLKDGRIWATHLSPHGKRLEEFSGETAKELYKRLVVEHRITDLSHAAYLGYELARAEHALKVGDMYEQDAD